jgi:hypothetical protein
MSLGFGARTYYCLHALTDSLAGSLRRHGNGGRDCREAGAPAPAKHLKRREPLDAAEQLHMPCAEDECEEVSPSDVLVHGRGSIEEALEVLRDVRSVQQASGNWTARTSSRSWSSRCGMRGLRWYCGNCFCTGSGEDKSNFYVQMPWYRHGSLDKWVDGDQRPKWPKVRSVLLDALLGLAHLHDNGVIHSDVKPQNILIDRERGCLADCDISIDTNARTTMRGTQVAWTAGFAAPELISSRQATRHTDIFAYGKTVHAVESLMMEQTWGGGRLQS